MGLTPLGQGTGHSNAPYRYWLPEREAEWMRDPVYRIRKQDEETRAELGEGFASSSV